MRANRHVRDVCKIVEDTGFKVVGVEVRHHLRITTEPRCVFTACLTPGDCRAMRNFRADVRRAWRQLHEHPP